VPTKCGGTLTLDPASSSNSERYDLVVGPITHQAPQFGVVTTANYNQFRAGRRYEVRIVHQGTVYYMPEADYDYVAEIEAVSLPAGVVMQIDDADGILGTHGEPNTMNLTFDAAGKVAYVNLIKVNFLEDASQKYGWDNFTTTIPWKSVKVSDTDKCYAQIGPSEKANSIYFKSLQTDKVTVSPAQASSTPQTVTLTGIAEGQADVWSRFDSVDGTDLSQLSVAAYQEDSYTLAVRVVNEEDDDVQEIPVGNGKPNTDAVNTGSNGVCNTAALGDDVQIIPVGQGEPNQIAITAGADMILDTNVVAGDDVKIDRMITTGADGICNTIADVNDIQIISVNQGKPDIICINTGANGVCNTGANGDDEQIIPLNQGKPNEICVSAGANGFRDSVPGGDDQLAGDNITTGADGVCDTTADSTDDLSTDPFNDTASDLQTYLNDTIYNQAVVKWTVTKLPDMSVNFDIDRDGCLDTTNWTTSEMDIVINQCDDPNRNYVIFVVNNPSEGAGFMDFGQKWGFIHPGTGCPNMLQVTAHELGHGMGSLTHTPSDIDNLMYNYCGSASKKLRKQQWKDVQDKQTHLP